MRSTEAVSFVLLHFVLISLDVALLAYSLELLQEQIWPCGTKGGGDVAKALAVGGEPGVAC